MIHNKTLNMRIRRLICVVMIFVFTIALSSCGSSNITGSLDVNATYASIGNYSVTNGELWNELKWDASDYINEVIEDAVIEEYYTKVVDTMNGEDSDLKTKYTKELKKYAIRNVYSFTESSDYEDKLADLTTKQKTTLAQTYADQLYSSENVTIDINTLIVDGDYSSLYKFYYRDLAKKLLAYDKLEEEIADAVSDAESDSDDDTVGYWSKSSIINKFTDEYRYTGNSQALLIRFLNSDEVTTTLRSFGLKTYKSNWYYVFPSTTMNFNDYCDFYDDFSITDSANKENFIQIDASFGEGAILSLYIEMYNYIYTYRNQLSNLGQNFVTSDTSDRRSVTQNIINYYTSAETLPTVDTVFENIKTSEYVNFTADEVNDIDSSLKAYLYGTLSTDTANDSDAIRYTTSGREYNGFYYLIFKVSQEADTYEDVYSDDLTTDEKYNNIISNETLYAEILELLKEDTLTDNYITTKVSEAQEDAKVRVYDKEIEIALQAKTDSYSKNHKSAPNKNTLATVKYNKKTTYIVVLPDDNSDKSVWNELEMTSGVTTAVDIISNKMVKDSDEYKDIDKDTIEDFKTNINQLLASFANDGLSSYGYASTLGKYNFMMLYFHSANINDIINNYYKVQYIYSDIINNYENTDLLAMFLEYAKKAYENYFSINDSRLVVYIDMDEDNVADDLSTWTSEQITAAKELVDKIVNIVLSSTDDHTTALESIVSEYTSSSRFGTGNELPSSEDYDPTSPECKWATYRRLGLYVKVETDEMTNSVTDSIDENVKARLKAIYNMEGFRINSTIPSEYLDDATVDEWSWTGSDSVTVTGTKYLVADDGLTLIVVTSASNPASALFEQTDSDINELYTNLIVLFNEKVYTIADVYNSNDEINLNQLKLFLYEYLENSTSNLTPSAISSALTTFFQPVLTRYTDSTTQREVLLNYINANTTGDLTFTNTDNNTRLTQLLAINRRTADNYVDENDMSNNFGGWWTKLNEVIAKESN